MRKDLQKFLKEYERQTNTHDFSNVRPLIATNAIYWFSDGTHKGINAIEQAFTSTWRRIKDESYQISNIRWLAATDTIGVCTYEFQWKGMVRGKRKSGRGRGTNIIIKRGNKWQMLHEHMSVKSSK